MPGNPFCGLLAVFARIGYALARNRVGSSDRAAFECAARDKQWQHRPTMPGQIIEDGVESRRSLGISCPCRAALWFVEAISLLLRAGKRHGISRDVEHICKLIGSLHVFGESKHVNLVGRAGGED